MRGYRVWDLKARKIREVSFYFCVLSEGFFPFNKKNLLENKQEEPFYFYPTLEAFLQPQEWQKFNFSKQQEEEVIEKQQIRRSLAHTQTHTDRSMRESGERKHGEEKQAPKPSLSLSDKPTESQSKQKQQQVAQNQHKTAFGGVGRCLLLLSRKSSKTKKSENRKQKKF